MSYKDKQSIQKRIKEKLSNEELEWENPHRVSEDFTQGVRDQRKGLTSYLRNARAAEKHAYLSFNKLVIENRSFLLDEATGGLKAIRKSDQIYANRFTQIYVNTDFTRDRAHGSVDRESRGMTADPDDTDNRTYLLAGSSQPDNFGPR